MDPLRFSEKLKKKEKMNEIDQIRASIREKMREMEILKAIVSRMEEDINEGRGEDEDNIKICDYCFGCGSPYIE